MSHCMNQLRLDYWRIYVSAGLNKLTHLPMGATDVLIELIIFKLISRKDILSIPCKIALGWIAPELTDD